MTPNPALARLGLSPEDRVLVIHLDDVGVCHAANEAWKTLSEEGSITSASIMTPCPWAPEALAYAKDHPQVDLGVHLTLTSEWDNYRWGPISENSGALRDDEGRFPRITRELIRRSGDQKGREAVRREMDRQIRLVEDIGFNPTHLDTHMISALALPFYEDVMDLALERVLPLMTFRDTKSWRPWCRPEELPQRVEISQKAEAAGMPLFDRFVGVPLGDDPSTWPLENRKARVHSIIDECIPGLNYLFLHAAVDGPELRGFANDWPARAGDLKVFSGSEIREYAESRNIHLVGMKPLRDLMRR